MRKVRHVVSGRVWWHMTHLSSAIPPKACKFRSIGNHSLSRAHAKIFTLRGDFIFQMNGASIDCNPGLIIARYAVLELNILDEFHLHVKVPSIEVSMEVRRNWNRVKISLMKNDGILVVNVTIESSFISEIL